MLIFAFLWTGFMRNLIGNEKTSPSISNSSMSVSNLWSVPTSKQIKIHQQNPIPKFEHNYSNPQTQGEHYKAVWQRREVETGINIVHRKNVIRGGSEGGCSTEQTDPLSRHELNGFSSKWIKGWITECELIKKYFFLLFKQIAVWWVSLRIFARIILLQFSSLVIKVSFSRELSMVLRRGFD